MSEDVKDRFARRQINYYHEEAKGVLYLQFCSSKCPVMEGFLVSCHVRYTVLKFVFILMEVALIMFIALDSNWERDLPLDPTGEIDRFQEFVQSDIEFCKWIGIAVIIVQDGSNKETDELLIKFTFRCDGEAREN
ncbi:hypothetical protein E3N88_45045 [Mikania micrantha]|uniref:Uncharacterized protein n=1 Tax=Mikania micrantha TaxID=192012 RepID=A0A5N6LAB0_9ASTR|nr:hypothetical protein E3N88_45045 [Mikania micrantha]